MTGVFGCEYAGECPGGDGWPIMWDKMRWGEVRLNTLVRLHEISTRHTTHNTQRTSHAHKHTDGASQSEIAKRVEGLMPRNLVLVPARHHL